MKVIHIEIDETHLKECVDLSDVFTRAHLVLINDKKEVLNNSNGSSISSLSTPIGSTFNTPSKLGETYS